VIVGTRYTSPLAHPKQQGFLIDRLEVMEFDKIVEVYDRLREIFLKPSLELKSRYSGLILLQNRCLPVKEATLEAREFFGHPMRKIPDLLIGLSAVDYMSHIYGTVIWVPYTILVDIYWLASVAEVIWWLLLRTNYTVPHNLSILRTPCS
jgi:hypothetical protein